MPEAQITAPNLPWGMSNDSSVIGTRTVPMVNASSLTVLKNSAVCLSTTAAVSSSAQPKFRPVIAAAADVGVIGVLDDDTPSGEIGMVCVEGPHLVNVSTSAIPTQKDLLATSTAVAASTTGEDTGGLVKTSTAGTPIGTVIGIALSSTLDGSASATRASAIWAWIHKA